MIEKHHPRMWKGERREQGERDPFRQDDDVFFQLYHFGDECEDNKFGEEFYWKQEYYVNYEIHHPNHFEWI